MLIRQHDARIADLQFRMSYPAIVSCHAHDFHCAERLLVKLDGRRRTRYVQVRSNCVVSIGNWFCHGPIVPGIHGAVL